MEQTSGTKQGRIMFILKHHKLTCQVTSQQKLLCAPAGRVFFLTEAAVTIIEQEIIIIQ